MNNFQCSHFFRNKQNFLAFCKVFCNNVCYRLAFARTRRALKNKANAFFSKKNCFLLACICVNNLKGILRFIVFVKIVIVYTFRDIRQSSAVSG